MDAKTAVDRTALGYDVQRLDTFRAADDRHEPVSLLIQRRRQAGRQWVVVAWRSVYPGTRSNRRFFTASDGTHWSTDVRTALDLLEQAESAGYLRARNDDEREDAPLGARTFSSMRDATRAYGGRVLVPSPFDKAELVVDCDDPNPRWRKLMAVAGESVTFWSLTADPDYRPRKSLDADGWDLDNSMQDINVQQARLLLGELRARR